MLGRVGIDPDQLLDRKATGEMLASLGFRCGWQTLAKLACQSVDGPEYIHAFGRTLYRAGTAATWAIGRAQKPKDSPQARTALLRRQRGDVLGRSARADVREGAAAQEAVAA
jgi:hypothetical protein